jgi:hypothetical protein
MVEEREFIEQRTKQILVEICDEIITRKYSSKCEGDDYRPYIDYAIEREWMKRLSTKNYYNETVTVTSEGWKVAILQIRRE